MEPVEMEQLKEWEESTRILFAAKAGKLKGKKVNARLYVRLGRNGKTYELDINGESHFTSPEADTVLWHYNKL
jgi:hypothetical protein